MRQVLSVRQSFVDGKSIIVAVRLDINLTIILLLSRSWKRSWKRLKTWIQAEYHLDKISLDLSIYSNRFPKHSFCFSGTILIVATLVD